MVASIHGIMGEGGREGCECCDDVKEGDQSQICNDGIRQTGSQWRNFAEKATEDLKKAILVVVEIVPLNRPQMHNFSVPIRLFLPPSLPGLNQI